MLVSISWLPNIARDVQTLFVKNNDAWHRFSPHDSSPSSRLYRVFHNRNLLLRQPIEVVHKPINLAVSRVDLTLEAGLVIRMLSFAQALV